MIVVRRCGYFLLVTIILAFAIGPWLRRRQAEHRHLAQRGHRHRSRLRQRRTRHGGTIHFNPSNSGRIVPTRSAEIGPDGKYTIKTYTGDNQVTYGGEVAAKNRGVGLRRDFATVQSGENQFDFDVLGAGGKDPTIDLHKER